MSIRPVGLVHQVAPELAGVVLVLITPNSGPRPFFSGRLGGVHQHAAPRPSISVWQRAWARIGILPPPQIAVPGLFFGAPWLPPPVRSYEALNCGLAARAGISAPRIGVPGRFFGAPRWPPPAPCSVALNCGLAVRAGISAPRIAVPGRFFRGALVASASALLRGPQFRIAWLSVATETIGVRRNKYRFRNLHIYVMKPITWQPSRIQTDGERQWAETVVCFIGGPR